MSYLFVRKFALADFSEHFPVTAHDDFCGLSQSDLASQFALERGRGFAAVHNRRHRAGGIEAIELAAELLHPTMHGYRCFKQEGAGGVGLESAHRDLAPLNRDRVASRIEAFKSEGAETREQAARVAVHDLLRFQLGIA